MSASTSLFSEKRAVDDDEDNDDDDEEDDDDDHDDWLNLYIDSDDDDEEEEEESKDKRPPPVDAKPKAAGPFVSINYTPTRQRKSKAMGDLEKVRYNAMCSSIIDAIRQAEYTRVTRLLNENGKKLKSVGRFLRSIASASGCRCRYTDEKEERARVIKRLIEMPCHQKASAITTALFDVSLEPENSNSDLPRMLIDLLLRLSVPSRRVEEMIDKMKAYMGTGRLPFLREWLERTTYPLSFDLSDLGFYNYSFNEKHDTIDMIRRAAVQSRLKMFLQPTPNDPRINDRCPSKQLCQAVFALWQGDDNVVQFARYLKKTEQRDERGWLLDPPRMLHDRSLYRDELTNDAWSRVQHACYFNYARALGHIEEFPQYVVVWIIEWLIENKDVRHIVGVRMVERVLAMHRRVRERVALASDAKNQK